MAGFITKPQNYDPRTTSHAAGIILCVVSVLWFGNRDSTPLPSYRNGEKRLNNADFQPISLVDRGRSTIGPYFL